MGSIQMIMYVKHYIKVSKDGERCLRSCASFNEYDERCDYFDVPLEPLGQQYKRCEACRLLAKEDEPVTINGPRVEMKEPDPDMIRAFENLPPMKTEPTCEGAYAFMEAMGLYRKKKEETS